jgi:hypothetical protein
MVHPKPKTVDEFGERRQNGCKLYFRQRIGWFLRHRSALSKFGWQPFRSVKPFVGSRVLHTESAYWALTPVRATTSMAYPTPLGIVEHSVSTSKPGQPPMPALKPIHPLVIFDILVAPSSFSIFTSLHRNRPNSIAALPPVGWETVETSRHLSRPDRRNGHAGRRTIRNRTANTPFFHRLPTHLTPLHQTYSVHRQNQNQGPSPMHSGSGLKSNSYFNLHLYDNFGAPYRHFTNDRP